MTLHLSGFVFSKTDPMVLAPHRGCGLGEETQFSLLLGERFIVLPMPKPLVEADQLDNAARNRSNF
jgi:hypothetical protein